MGDRPIPSPMAPGPHDRSPSGVPDLGSPLIRAPSPRFVSSKVVTGRTGGREGEGRPLDTRTPAPVDVYRRVHVPFLKHPPEALIRPRVQPAPQHVQFLFQFPDRAPEPGVVDQVESPRTVEYTQQAPPGP